MLDLDEMRVTYVVRKGLHDQARRRRTIEFMEDQAAGGALSATYFGPNTEPFAALHRSGA